MSSEATIIYFLHLLALIVIVYTFLKYKNRPPTHIVGTIFMVDAEDPEEMPEIYMVSEPELFTSNDEYAVIRIVKKARD